MKISANYFGICSTSIASTLLPQAGQGQSGSTSSQPSQNPGSPGARCEIVRDDYMSPVTFTQVEIRDQASLRRQLEDHVKALGPMSEREVTSEVRPASADALLKEVKGRGVDFDMTPAVEKKLRKAKVSDEVIEAARQAGPKVHEQMAKMILGTETVRIAGYSQRADARAFRPS